MLEFLALAQECAPTVSPQTMAAIINVESGYHPYAIGVVGGRLTRQPANPEEAIATAKALEADGWNFSMGVAQVNRYNLPRYQITYEQAFDACTNLRVGSKILEECFMRASKRITDSQAALQAAISCYYSGNFTRGFQPDAAGKPSYVQKVLASAAMPAKAIPVVPSIQTGNGTRPQAGKAAVAATPAALRQTQNAQTSTPSDNSPVLLRPSNSANGVSNPASPAAADPAAAVVDPGARNKETRGEVVPPGTADTRRSTIVF
jgi:type IV secretion system protein VirB1